MTALLTFLRSAPFCPLPLGRDLRLGCSRPLTCGPTLNVAFIKPDLLSRVVRHGWGGEQLSRSYWESLWITAGSWSSSGADAKVGVSIESTPLGRSRYK